MSELALAMTAGFHRELRRHLFPGDGLEAAAVVLCNQGTGRRRRRLLAAEMLSVPHRRSSRRRDHVAWPFAEHLPPDKIGAIDRGGATARAQRDTRHYAKRQFTWFRRRYEADLTIDGGPGVSAAALAACHASARRFLSDGARP